MDTEKVDTKSLYIFDTRYFVIEIVQLVVLIAANLRFMYLRKTVAYKFFLGSWLVVLI